MNTYHVTAAGKAGTMSISYDADGSLQKIIFSEDCDWAPRSRRFILGLIPEQDVMVEKPFEEYRRENDPKRVFTITAEAAMPTFEDFWKAYPALAAQKGSKTEAEKKWNKMGESDRLYATAFLKTYKTNLKLTSHYPKHVVTYLNQQLWVV